MPSPVPGGGVPGADRHVRGEEGLERASTDMVIFYEAVPSEIRPSSAREGPWRHGAGKIIVLVTNEDLRRGVPVGEPGEGAGHARGMKTLAAEPAACFRIGRPRGQCHHAPLSLLGPDHYGWNDSWRASSRVVGRPPPGQGTDHAHRLEEGDYAAGDRILVERKTSRDFMDTAGRADLSGTAGAPAASAPAAVLIDRGTGPLLGAGRESQNAVRGRPFLPMRRGPGYLRLFTGTRMTRPEIFLTQPVFSMFAPHRRT